VKRWIVEELDAAGEVLARVELSAPSWIAARRAYLGETPESVVPVPLDAAMSASIRCTERTPLNTLHVKHVQR
jgi:hypothetical protein